MTYCLPNKNLTSPTTNILEMANDQCLEMKNQVTTKTTVRPVILFPQRRKRRRIHINIKTEATIENNFPLSPQMNIDFNDSQISNGSNSSSEQSPVQELVGEVDEILAYFDDVYDQDDIKPICDFPSIDDINYTFGMNITQEQFSLLTPTMSTLNFFS